RAGGQAGRRGWLESTKPSCEHTLSVSTPVTRPSDDEVAGAVHGHPGILLLAGRYQIDREFSPHSDSSAVKAPTVDPLLVAILVALPNHYEISIQSHCNGWRSLEVLVG